MAANVWQISGDYFETCNCDYLCPCIPSNLSARPTHGYCDVAMVFHIEKGSFDQVALDGLSFALVAHTPEVMGHGNWSVGLIIDERANAEQEGALQTIGSGQGGGPVASLAPLLGTFLGFDRRPIRFEKSGLKRTVAIPSILEQGCEGVASAVDSNQPLYIDNTLHPANTRLALAHATHSHLHAFGIDWDDTSGKNNGHFAPFDWHSS